MKNKCQIGLFLFALSLPLMAQSSYPSDAEQNPSQAPNSRQEGEYVLGPEDVIEVFVWKEPDLSVTAMVRPDGKVSLPLIGELQASGNTPAQLQREIAEGLRQFVAHATVNVVLREVNSPKISVLGEVRKPDQYKIRQRVTVLDAIALAGGFTEFARQNEVIVLRSGQRIKLNLKRLLKDGPADPFYLRSLDTVYVQ